MKKEIRFCEFCKRYTLKELCPICGKETKIKKPPKYSFGISKEIIRQRILEKYKVDIGKC